MSLRQAAQTALDAQNACNVAAVVHAFARITETLWNQARMLGCGTDWVNHHPITVLFAAAIGNITRTSVMCDEAANYTKCFYICGRLAAGEEVPVAEYPYEES